MICDAFMVKDRERTLKKKPEMKSRPMSKVASRQTSRRAPLSTSSSSNRGAGAGDGHRSVKRSASRHRSTHTLFDENKSSTPFVVASALQLKPIPPYAVVVDPRDKIPVEDISRSEWTHNGANDDAKEAYWLLMKFSADSMRIVLKAYSPGKTIDKQNQLFGFDTLGVAEAEYGSLLKKCREQILQHDRSSRSRKKSDFDLDVDRSETPSVTAISIEDLESSLFGKHMNLALKRAAFVTLPVAVNDKKTFAHPLKTTTTMVTHANPALHNSVITTTTTTTTTNDGSATASANQPYPSQLDWRYSTNPSDGLDASDPKYKEKSEARIAYTKFLTQLQVKLLSIENKNFSAGTLAFQSQGWGYLTPIELEMCIGATVARMIIKGTTFNLRENLHEAVSEKLRDVVSSKIAELLRVNSRDS